MRNSILACVAFLFTFMSVHAQAQQPPNVIILLADDLGYGDLGCYGHPIIKSPHLDRLAAEGMKLSDFYAAAPVCSPSRAGMLTGRIPNRLGIYDWIPQGSPMHMQAREVTIAELLKTCGYETCIGGKYHCNGLFNNPRQPQPGDQGFDHWFCTQNNAAPNHRNPTNFVRNSTRVGPTEAYSATVIVNEAIDWLKNRKEPAKPFLLLVWFHNPHEIVATADEFRAMYEGKGTPDQIEYYGNVTQMDHEAGRLLSLLDDQNLRENTLVLFSSDNGPETLDRYRTANHSHGATGGLRAMKLHMYEGGLRVPGIVRFPPRIKPGTVSSEPAAFVDLLPTLCELSGAALPADRPLDGTSLLPLFSGEKLSRRQPLYWQYNVAISKPKIAMREGDWKLLASIDSDGAVKDFELYNLRQDVREENNLAQREAQRLAAMKSQLMKLHTEIKAEGPVWPPTSQRTP